MDVTLSQRSRKSHSKRGIKVTLSKQKQNINSSKHQYQTDPLRSQQWTANSDVKTYNHVDFTSGNRSEHQEHKHNSKDVSQFQPSMTQSVKSDLVTPYLQKSRQKRQIIDQSQRLQQQIRNLQLQIYNTRTKITEDKYLTKKSEQLNIAQIVQNNKRYHRLAIKQKENKQVKISKSSKSLKNGKIQINSVKKSDKRSPVKIEPVNTFQAGNISRSPSPPHPSLLKQMLLRKNQQALQYQNYRNTFKGQNPLDTIEQQGQNRQESFKIINKSISKLQNQLKKQKKPIQDPNIKQPHKKKRKNSQNVLKAKQQKNSKRKNRSFSTFSNKLDPSNLYIESKPMIKDLKKKKSKITDFDQQITRYIKKQQTYSNLKKGKGNFLNQSSSKKAQGSDALNKVYKSQFKRQNSSKKVITFSINKTKNQSSSNIPMSKNISKLTNQTQKPLSIQSSIQEKYLRRKY